MEKVNEIKNTEIKTKKDFKPICIYFVFQIVFGAIIGLIAGVTKKPELLENYFISFIIPNALVILIIGIMYFKRVKTDIKRLTRKNIKFIILMSILTLLCNGAISILFSFLNVSMNNQNTVTDVLGNYVVIGFIITVLLAPLVEEIVFRYSLSSIIKNRVIFVIVSSLLFGIMHGIGIATFLYAFLGMMFAIMYIKTDDNVVSPYIAHMINNLVAVTLMLI